MAVLGTMRLIARGKAIDDNREVIGYVRIMEFTPRERITQILEISSGKNIAVDPVSVEMFTGLRDVFGERIFEGDVIQYYHEFDGAFRAEDDDSEGEEPLCEICMPLVLPKAGVRKQLYQHTTALLDGTYYCNPSGMGETAHLWDAMDWLIVGRVDDEVCLSRHERDVCVLRGELKEKNEDDELVVMDDLMASGACEKSGNIPVFNVEVGDGEKCRRVVPYFGTQKRRAHILKHIFSDPTYFRRHPKLECKRKEWEELYDAYVKAWEAPNP